MAIADFTGSDVLLVLGAAGAAGATVLSAWLANRRPREVQADEDAAAALQKLRLHVAENFMPRQEVATNVASLMMAIDNLREEQIEERRILRDQVQDMLVRNEEHVRDEMREMRGRLDRWLTSLGHPGGGRELPD
jgi:hypothetical protein